MGVVVAVPASRIGLVRLGAVGVGLVLLAAAAAFVALRRAVPPAFALHPTELATVEESGGGIDSVSRIGAGRFVVVRAVIACVSGGAKDLVILPMLFLIGFVLAGTLGGAVGDPDLDGMRPPYLPIATYMFFVSLVVRLGRLQMIDPLPIARAVLVAPLVLPPFVALAVGYGAGLVAADRLGFRQELVDYRLWRAGSRAARAAYGVRIPPEETASRCLRETPEGQVEPAGDGLRLRERFGGFPVETHGSFALLLAVATGLPGLVWIALFLRSYRAGYSPRLRQRAFAVFVVLCVVLMFAATGAMISQYINPALGVALLQIFAREIDSNVAGAAVAWLLGLGLLAVGFLVVRRQFERMEIPVHPTRYSLLDKEQTGT